MMHIQTGKESPSQFSNIELKKYLENIEDLNALKKREFNSSSGKIYYIDYPIKPTEVISFVYYNKKLRDQDFDLIINTLLII